MKKNLGLYGFYASECVSHSVVPSSLWLPWTVAHQAPLSIGDSPGKNTGVGLHALLQGFFPTQVSNPGLLHCKQVLYRLSHQGSPRILEWVAYPFSRRSSWPGIKPGSPALQVDSLPAELPGKHGVYRGFQVAHGKESAWSAEDARVAASIPR